MNGRLKRMEHYDDGTFGVLILSSGGVYYTVEQPWKDNRPNLSSIPAGEYLCVPRQSPRYGKTYHVLDVPGRSLILFHPANFGGDREKGLRSDLQGCIGLGLTRGTLAGQHVVLSSRTAIKRFHEELDWQDFTLVIEEVTL